MCPLDGAGDLIGREAVKHDSLQGRGNFIPRTQRRLPNVTVCISARSGAIVMGASDRMLTSGDIQFEPPLTSKLTLPTSSIGILQAGHAAFHSDIMCGVLAEVQD